MAHLTATTSRPRHLTRARSSGAGRALTMLVASVPLLVVPLFPVGRTAGLDLRLAKAVAAAQVSSVLAGHPFVVSSGRRSAAEQQALLDTAVATYGSRAEAERWVLPPERSQHVRGLAVDVKPVGGAAWLDREGHRWGLCRRYANETWHFELLTAPGRPCPALEPDAAG